MMLEMGNGDHSPDGVTEEGRVLELESANPGVMVERLVAAEASPVVVVNALTSPSAPLPPPAPSLAAAKAVALDQAAAGWPAPSAFPPIADYGYLSDCEANALIAPDGSVEWLCLPRPDSPSVFGAILDRAAGGFRLGPPGVTVPAARRYLPGTTVLETTWQTSTGWLLVQDFLSIGPWYHHDRRSETHRRPPTDHEAEHTLVRLVQCLSGTVDVVLDCEPVFDYGRAPAAWCYTGSGYGEAAAGVAGGGDPQLRLTTDLRPGFEGPRAHARTELRAGERAFVALSWSDGIPPSSYAEASERLDRTSEYWRRWLARGRFPDHPWRSYLERSALTLKGLSYSPTGALLAAATTSLPELAGGARNWDYRYTWIRDATLTLWGMDTLGFGQEATDFFNFLTDACQDAPMQLMYGVGAERELAESTLEHLAGYQNSRPVRIGNAAYSQAQHDMWGAIVDAVARQARSRGQLSERVWSVVASQVEQAIARWPLPDRGFWEVRGEPQHFTSSKLMCWLACEQGARLARLRDDQVTELRWSTAAAAIHADICANGLDGRGVFTQAYGNQALDASLLLMPLVGFLPPSDPRIRDTVLAIADELTVDEHLVLRYRAEETDDGLAGQEGSFVICSFWLVSALAAIGELGRARRLCERLLGCGGPLQLYAEVVEFGSGRQIGNFPQAFSHLSLINAVMDVIRAEQAAVHVPVATRIDAARIPAGD